MAVETGETIEITFSWAFALRAYSINMLDGTDYATRRESAEEVAKAGKLLDLTLAFITEKGLMDEFRTTAARR